VGVLGRNGAGKTTLFRTVMGLIPPDEGMIRFQGEAAYVGQKLSEQAKRSGYELRRIEISRAMSSKPALLLLDEPFSGVDPIRVPELKALIRDLARQGTGVLFSDHNARESLNLCDRAYILHEGRFLAHGTPGDLSKG
ncbi:MAG TPA: ATP-binding cassette domain-containing protein, partial [Planctomycetota bacterium]|nr:ATP-binding cassette domain-containing protein [Planctomycetota bacterium]